MVESTHHGSLVVLGPDGATVLTLGDVERPVFPRSANKPLQAVGMLLAGWLPDDDRALALASASHSGEPAHLAVVRAILGPAGEDALRCPPSLPLDETAARAVLAAGGGPSRLQMNCSGKHAAMIATCRANGWPAPGYLDPDHPLQRALTATVQDMAGESVRHVAVDGCGAPQHALTLRGLARAFARLAAAGPGTASGRTAQAMRTHPELVGGTGRDVTLVMQAVPGLLAKDGAEGVYAAALPDGSAVALKIEDGAARARMPVLVAALASLGATGAGLDALAVVPVLGGDARVGEARVAGELAQVAGRS